MTRTKGEGSWRTRSDGRIEYALPIGRTANGNTKRKSFYGTSKKEILGQVEAWRKTHLEHGVLEPNRFTVNEFFARHLEHREVVQKRISALTRKDYEFQYDRNIRSSLGHFKLTELTPTHISDWQTNLANRHLGARTLQYAYRILKSCLEFATKLRLIPFNPASGVPAPTVEHSEKQAYTRDEARTYLEAARLHRLAALFLLVLTTGLRRSEIFGLRWEDVDFDRLEIRIRQRIRWVRGGGFNVGQPKTKRSRRTIPISTDTAQALLRWREQQQLERSHAGSDWLEHGLVFTSQGGNPLHPSTLTKAHDFIIAKADIRRLTVHELRHSFTSLARAAGVDLKVISEILGHATVAFTADFYQHTFEEMRREVARTAQELTGLSSETPTPLTPERLELWRGLVGWLEQRPEQAAHRSQVPFRYRMLLEDSNLQERQAIKLVAHVRSLGWCLRPDHLERLKVLKK
jgi:integrase